MHSRSVSLLGIDSVYCPAARRRTAWRALADELPPALLDEISHRVTLEQVPEAAAALLDGRQRGRTVVELG